MKTLAEIEEVADTLPNDQKQELMLFLAARLRAGGVQWPEPRNFSREQIYDWIEEDKADLTSFKQRE